MQQTDSIEKITIGISSCLLGEKVRFDSGHKKNAYIVNELSKYFNFKAFCPEVAIGLGIPRPTIRLIKAGEQIRCVNSNDDSIDVTDALAAFSEAQKPVIAQLSGYIVKKDSPSCGMTRVKVYRGNHPQRDGVGIFTQRLMANFPHLPIEEEGRLNDAVLRENFLSRVFIYHRWQKLQAENPSWADISRFHARHKYLYMSRSQFEAKQLGRWLAQNHELEPQTLSEQYLGRMMTLLKIQATVKKHVNTLAHLQGYLKKHLEGEDKQELVSVIEEYRQGNVPLVVPMTLLKHHFKHHPHQYISDSYYLAPYPSDLKLMNSL